jgi:hypothetical protein
MKRLFLALCIVLFAVNSWGAYSGTYTGGSSVSGVPLTALSTVTPAANAIPYFTSATAASVISSSANMVSLLGSANYAAARTNLGLAIGTNVQAYDAELAALAGLTSAANAIPYFTGSGTAGVISSSANMVSFLASADYATALTNLGGQASDSALTSLSSKVFAKTALTGAGGLDTVLYDDISDGDIGMVGTVAGVIYWYIFEASSATAESSPSVIAPDDIGANNGRWLLKLYCDGSSCTVPQQTTGSYTTWLEGSAGGTNFRRISVPDALTADLTLRLPNTLPGDDQVLVFSTPVDGVSEGVWTDMSEVGGGTGDLKADGTVPMTGALVPNAANTIALGSASAEWADIYLGDSAVIYGENDQSNTITSSSAGWTFAKGITATTVSTAQSESTAGYLRLLEGSNNGTDYSQISGLADAGTTAAFTFGGSSTTESVTLTIPASTSTEATVSSSTGITSLNFSAMQIRDTKVITADTDNEAMTASQMGRIWTNTGDGDGTVFTLPEASTVLGQSVTFAVTVAQNLDVNPNDGTDQIMGLTNAAGDAVRCATIGCTLTLTAVTANMWMVTSSYGTWSDVN